MKNMDNIQDKILDVLKKIWKSGGFDYLLAPVQIPAGDSYSYVLMQRNFLPADTCPLPPVMPVQGAKVISHLTKNGRSKKIIACVMRACEIRAAVELCKLEQVKLDNILLISIDCPGVLPLSQYNANPENAEQEFSKIIEEWGNDAIRPVCKTCLNSNQVLGDLHIGFIEQNKQICLVPGSDKGEVLLKNTDMDLSKGTDKWKNKIEKIRSKKEETQKKSDAELIEKIQGLSKLSEIFAKCIGCHICMSVCPICYCRLCYFDSGNVKHESEDFIKRAINHGGLNLPCDILLYHTGRMSHMSLSCVGCGACEDVCPVNIPVAQVFNFVARRNQKLFEYTPGMNREEKPPLAVYKEEEFEEFEDTN